MNNLEYDNLYKFLVSLGIVLIALPIVVVAFLFNSDPILISQTDFESLSNFSLEMIQQREKFMLIFIKAIPWVAVILILLGILLLVYGIYKWHGIQKNLDKKLDAETTIQTLTVLQMNNTEIKEKIESEIKEDIKVESQNIDEMPVDSHLSRIKKYIQIEDLCYNYFTQKYGSKKYTFKRNIRIGKFSYDFIGVSKNDNIDLIFEIKYWVVADRFTNQLYNFLDDFHDMGVNYETIAHRNFKCIAVLVTPKEHLPKLKSIIEAYCKAHKETANKIQIKCFSDDSF